MFFLSMALFKAKHFLMGKVLQSVETELTTHVGFRRTASAARLYMFNRSFNAFSMAKSISAELLPIAKLCGHEEILFCHANFESVCF